MLRLEESARALVEAIKAGRDTQPAAAALDVQLKDIRMNRLAHENTIETARNIYATDDIEIDDDPILSVADEGVWVGAWVWVPIEQEGD